MKCKGGGQQKAIRLQIDGTCNLSAQNDMHARTHAATPQIDIN